MQSQKSILFLFCLPCICIILLLPSCNDKNELPNDIRFNSIFEYSETNDSIDLTNYSKDQLQDYWAIQNGIKPLPKWISNDVKYIQSQKYLIKNLGLNEFEIIDVPFTESIIGLEKFKLSVIAQNSKLSPIQVNKIQNSIKIAKIESQEDLYIYIELLKILGAHFKSKNQMNASWSTYLKGIHTIDQLSTEKYDRLRDKLIYEMLTSISKEQDAGPYRKMLSYLKGRMSEKYFTTYEGHMTNSYLTEENLNEANFNHFKILEKAIEISQNSYEKANAHFNLGYYHAVNSNQSKATNQYKLALELFENKCHKLYYSILMYLIDDASQHNYIDTLLQYKNCSDEIQSKISFLIPGYIDIDLIGSSRVQKSEIILDSRRNADKMFPGYSTLHLQDYFIGNYVNLLNLFISNFNVSDDEVSLIINTCFDTRQRDLLRQELQSSMEGDLQKRGAINNLLKDVNEFKEYFPYKREVYDKLFYSFISINEIEKKTNLSTINLSLLKSKLERDKIQLLNIVKSFDNYFYYLYDGNQFIVDTINSKNLEERGKELFKSITTLSQYESKNLDDLLSLIPISKSKDLVLIADGVFTSIPLDIFLPKFNISTYSNIEQYVNSKDISIYNSSLNSYSSIKSINDKSPKLYPELKHGLDEVLQINNILSNTLRKNSFKDYLADIDYESDLLHISSHAFSSTENRLNNYFIYRDKSGKPEKKYGFELYEQNTLPKVVILSACETGIGIPAYGAGVQTLSRAFLDNGTQTVIKTLWKVNEKATAEFMVEMYKFWATGISLYEALEKTKNLFKNHEKYSHQYYWAGFVLEGNPNVYLDITESSKD